MGVLGVMYFLELIVRCLAADGFRNYWFKHVGNRIDCCAIVISFSVEIWSFFPIPNPPGLYKIVNITRLIRSVRLLTRRAAVRDVAQSLLGLCPALWTLFSLEYGVLWRVVASRQPATKGYRMDEIKLRSK